MPLNKSTKPRKRNRKCNPQKPVYWATGIIRNKFIQREDFSAILGVTYIFVKYNGFSFGRIHEYKEVTISSDNGTL